MEGKKHASQPLKKMIPPLLISVSLFSFLLSYSSLLYTSSSSISPKFHHYFSANSSHLLNKNCLFLICNGLLVFLAKTSGFIQPPTAHDITDILQISSLDKYVLEDTDGGKIADDNGTKEVSIFIAESEEEEEEEGGAAASDSPRVDEDRESQPDPATCWLFEEDELYGDGDGGGDEDGEEEEEEAMSTEELNRKFEDFIRKMKEEIVINEARQDVFISFERVSTTAIVQGIKEMLNREWSVTVAHVYREANLTADCLASLGLTIPCGLQQLDSAPSPVRAWIQYDAEGGSQPRSVLV